MHTNIFLSLTVSVIALAAFLALPVMLHEHAGFPMQITHRGLAEQQIQPGQGASLPIRLQPGDILDWSGTDLRTPTPRSKLCSGGNCKINISEID